MRRLALSIFCTILTSSVSSQETTLNQFDVLFYGGLQFEHIKRYVQGNNRTIWSLNNGVEFFCFNWMTVGVSLNCGNTNLVFQTLKDIEFYTTPSLNLYLNMFYLGGGYSYHKNIDHNFAYPNKREEHIFFVGIGKKIFISKHLLVDVGSRFYNSKRYALDSDGYRIIWTTSCISLNASLLIYFNTGNRLNE